MSLSMDMLHSGNFISHLLFLLLPEILKALTCLQTWVEEFDAIFYTVKVLNLSLSWKLFQALHLLLQYNFCA